MVAVFRCRNRAITASGSYRSGRIMREFLLIRINSLIIELTPFTSVDGDRTA